MTAAGVSGGARFGEAAGKSAGSRFSSIFKTAAKASLLGVIGAGALAVKIGKDSIGAASDLNESLNAVNVTYGKQSKAVKKLGREAADSLGLSNSEFNGLAVQYSAFAKTITGGDGKKVPAVLDDLTTRASDFASVMNLEVSDAAGLFQSGLAGETEPLRRYGLDLSAAKVEAYAYANGIAKAGEKLTEGQKVQARYASLMEQTKKTQGDFRNTSDQLANSQRILSAKWEDGKAKLGKGLLPIMTDAANFLLKKGIPAFENFSDWFTKDGIPAIKKFGGFVKDDVAPPLKKAAGFAKDLVGFLADLPKPAKIAGLATVLGGVGYTKLRGGNGGGGGGVLGGIGKAVGLAKPIKTFETNPAALGGPGKGGLPVPTGPGGPGKGGLAAFLKGGATPAAAAVLNKYLNDWFKSTFEPKGGVKGDPGKVISNIKIGEKAGFSDAVGKWVPLLDTAGEAARKSVEKADQALADLVNGGDAREAREQFRALKDEAKAQGIEIDVLKAKFPQYAGAIKSIPERHMTEFLLPNFLEQFNRINQYGSMLDGIPREVRTTFIQSIIRNNDIGEGGGGSKPHNANGTSFWRGGQTWVGERGPELVSLPRGSSVTPRDEVGSGRIVIEIGGEQFDARVRRVADDRYNANGRHPTGRR